MNLRTSLVSTLVSLSAGLFSCGGHTSPDDSSSPSLGMPGTAGGPAATEGAGGATMSNGTGGASSSPQGVAGAGVAGGSVVSAYDGKGFVVHEWGTNTIVVGSDGSLQRGLHHEEEDLPAFVYDRIKGGVGASVIEKMETPVTYFYSPSPRKVTAKVAFPAGVLTQWYPAVQHFTPQVADVYSSGTPTIMDPALDVHFPFMSAMCSSTFAHVQNGVLDWGEIEVLARDATPPMPDAPLDQFTWSYARDVAANPVRAAGPTAAASAEAEKFLFYRGLGNFPLPWNVTATSGGAVSLANTTKLALGAAFVLNVGKDRGAFHAHPEGVAPGAKLDELAPSLDTAPSIDAYADGLALAVIDALDATGLFHDESVAMVSTWKRQWFRTPGVRVLYLMPSSAIDEQIPLTITPAPDATVRVMMMRVEVITPELEAVDAKQALAFATDAEGGAAYFDALGRFAEPRLRRALALSGAQGAALDYLAKIATASTTLAPGE